MLIVGTGGEIVYLNTLAATLFGFGRSELLGRSIESLVPPEVRSQHIAHRKGYFDSPRVRIMETGLAQLYGLRKDGSRFPIEISLSPLHTPTGTLVLGAVRDRTQKEKIEAEIRALNRDLQSKVRELDTANREMQDFTYTTAHDLRAPVRHMQSFAELVRSSAASRLEESELDNLDKISAAKRLGVLIDGLLEFSRIGRMPMNRQSVDLSKLIASIQDGFDRELVDRRVQWTTGSLPVLLADPGMLRVLFTNLIANALKFTRGCDPAIIEIGSSSANGMVTIFIRDNGAGFDNEYAGKLFQVFQRLHRHDHFEGTGIGLASVRRLAERHGGKVSAEGTLGKGATFFISLPEGSAPHV
jgi:PAS domain S-box-containing protein